MNWKFWTWGQAKPVFPEKPFRPMADASPAEWTKPLLRDEEDSTETAMLEPPLVVPEPVKEPEPEDRMDPEIKARWVKLLRSGRLAQGQGRLRARKPHGKTQYCCLGVLCEIAVRDGVIEPSQGKMESSGQEGAVYVHHYGDDAAFLPPKVRAWARLDEADGIQCRGRNRTLVQLNDLEKLSFDEISDLIEEQL